MQIKLLVYFTRCCFTFAISLVVETATLTYKSLNSLAPNYLRKLFAECSDEREQFLRSSETDLKIPLLKTTSGQRAFSYRGAKLWNSLERATKLAPSL